MVYFSGGVENSATVDCRILSLMYCTGFASILIYAHQLIPDLVRIPFGQHLKLIPALQTVGHKKTSQILGDVHSCRTF